MIPEELRYTEEHEWVRIEGDEAIFGITDYAQKELGDITYIELPEKGRSLSHMDVSATIESVKAASDIFAPLTGEVIAVNNELTDAPEIINQSPYDRGWLCRIHIDNPAELEKLMDSKAYASLVEGLED